jgi:hypothetical protein
MTPEQKDALCEYVDGLRVAGRRFDEIAATLEGQLKESELEKLELWHRQWFNRQWREKKKSAQNHVPIDSVEIPIEDPEVEDWEGARGRGETELVRYLAEKLVGPDSRSSKPHWRVERGLSEWSASGAANATRPFLTLYLRHEIAKGRQWKPLYLRSLREGQTCENVKGAGKAAGVKWVHCAVIFRTGDVIDHIEVEARIRRRVYPDSPRAIRLGLLREAVQLEKLNLVREKLDQDEISARLAALMQTYLGKASGIKSGAHLGRLTNRTRQAVSARKLLIAEGYYETTGGRAGFQGLTSAKRHREKVMAQDSPTDGKGPL